MPDQPHAQATPTPAWKQTLFLAAVVACAFPSRASWVAPGALTLGIVFGLLGLSCWPDQSKKLSRWLLQGGIVALGLRLNLRELASAAADGFLLGAGTIAGALLLGALVGRVLGVIGELRLLISCGTAICGGSAIAAVGSAVRAGSSNMAVATGVIFLLNAIGVYTLPILGHKLGLTDAQFGAWAGVALHDMASVNAVAKGYGEGSVALDTANVTKLTRVVWIAPIALSCAWLYRKKSEPGRPQPRWQAMVPWFILWFIAACTLRTLVPSIASWQNSIKLIAGCAFQVALFLVGAGVTRRTLAQAGPRALALAVILWFALAGGTLLVIRAT